MDFVGPLDPTVPPFGFDIRGTVPAPEQRRPVDLIRYVVNHRAGGPGWPTEAPDLIAALLDAWEQGTKERACPYWALIEPGGRVVICHNLNRRGRHAGKYDAQGRPAGSYNGVGLAIGWIGDFRKHDVPDVQLDAGVRLNRWAIHHLGLTPRDVFGHDELPGATPGKVCPGPRLHMNALRAALLG